MGVARVSGLSVSRAVQSGERVDVTWMMEVEAPRILDYFSRRVVNVEDAADLLGECLMVVWRRRRSVPRSETEARMWMYGVARKVLGTHRRGSLRRTALTERLKADLLVASGSYPSGGVDDVHSHLRALIADLDEIDREIISLTYWEGFSLAEAASILSMRASTVRSRHARARAQLRRALLESDDIADD